MRLKSKFDFRVFFLTAPLWLSHPLVHHMRQRLLQMEYVKRNPFYHHHPLSQQPIVSETQLFSDWSERGLQKTVEHLRPLQLFEI